MAEVKLNSNHVNAKIKAHILPDDKMRKIGFTDLSKDCWYYFKNFGDIDVSFNVAIPKDGSDIRIDVLDEWFGQPYDYYVILETDPNHKIANLVKKRVEQQMEYLQCAGVLSGHNYGEYI